jgi:hypothetical protein
MTQTSHSIGVKGQGGSQLMMIFVPMIVISIIAISFAIVVSDIGPRYNVNSTDSSYSRIISASGNISSISDTASTSVVGSNNDQTNVLTSTERLVTGAYNAILTLGDVPQVYMAIIDSVADTIGIDSAIVNLILAGILLAIVSVIIYLALGRT